LRVKDQSRIFLVLFFSFNCIHSVLFCFNLFRLSSSAVILYRDFQYCQPLRVPVDILPLVFARCHWFSRISNIPCDCQCTPGAAYSPYSQQLLSEKDRPLSWHILDKEGRRQKHNPDKEKNLSQRRFGFLQPESSVAPLLSGSRGGDPFTTSQHEADLWQSPLEESFTGSATHLHVSCHSSGTLRHAPLNRSSAFTSSSPLHPSWTSIISNSSKTGQKPLFSGYSRCRATLYMKQMKPPTIR
jgi:hypothetical protein